METEQLLAQILLRHKGEQGGLLPLLHDVQELFGCIPPDAVPAIAQAMNLSRAEVHGVISFYRDFRTQPHGRYRVQICMAESCQAMGAGALENHAVQSLGVAMGETRADGLFTLEPVYCLGNCACSPSIRINNQVHALVDAARFDELCRALPKEGGDT